MPNINPNSTNYVHSYEPNTNDLTMAMDYNAAGEPVIRTTESTNISASGGPWYLQVARGLVTGCTYETRSAVNPDCDQDTQESIWVEGGIYPFTSWTTAQKLYVISTSASDTGQSIYIDGLDADYNHIYETVTTNGTTAVATTQNFLRIHTATIVGANQVNVGSITFRLVNGTGTVVAHIGAGLAVTKLSQYTVPAGYTAYVLYGDCTSFRAGSGNIGTSLEMKVRPYGGTFFTAFIAEVVNGYYRNDFTIPMPITEKSDIDVRVVADANNTKVTANYELLLIQNGL